jgi:glycosidase
MTRGDDGVWRVSVTLAPGSHLYKFVVDGASWIHDPANPHAVDDGHGGRNSVLRLGPEATLGGAASSVGDGRIEGAGILHDPTRAMCLQRLPDGGVLVRVRTLRSDVQSVELAMPGTPRRPLRPSGADEAFAWWEIRVTAPDVAIPYTFLFLDGATRVSDPRIYSLDSRSAKLFTTPAWTKDAVWYQIMLERFRDGDERNNPDPCRPWRSEWYSLSPWEGQEGRTFYKWDVFARHYGGDLAGLREKLGYLKDLGVNAIYLNPVFQAPSHHKYNATNFLHVDEHFGEKGDYAKAEAVEDLRDPSTWVWTPTDKLFLNVLQEAKRLGIRVIVDGVFNHVGTTHPAFRDVQARGAESPFRDWFSIRSWQPFEYDGWAGFGELPVFRKNERGFSSDEVKAHIFAVTRRWMDPDGDGDPSDGIDGWRLDVPNEIAMPFWHEWRELVKSINPDAYIVGEIWRRADDWLDGRSFDAVMNYPFAETMLKWVRDRQHRISCSEMDRRLAELRHAYPAEATYALQNLLDSHDTDRIVSKMLHPNYEYDKGNREQENPSYNGKKPGAHEYEMARLLAFVQMVYVGAPMVYYGDEVGMWGADDPTNRRPMLWKDLEPYDSPDDCVDDSHAAWYRRVIALRQAHPALRRGSFETVLCDDAHNVWVFVRELPEETLLVAVNASTSEAVLDLAATPLAARPGTWRSLFGAEGVSIVDEAFPRIGVAPLSGRVWKLEP